MQGASDIAELEANFIDNVAGYSARKKALATQVAKDVQFQALMEIWLYFHVPLSFGLLAALTAHIVSVFFYW